MPKRLALFAAAAFLASCGDADDAREEAFASAAEDSDRIECAVDGSFQFERKCVVERMEGPEGTSLTLRTPSGGFRRLLVTHDGRGVEAADGADPAIVTVLSDKRIEVSIAEDRYRLPATVQ